MMTKKTLLLLAGVCTMAPVMAGCIGGKNEGPATAQATPAANACSGLVDARRSAVRRIDDIEAGRSGGSAMAGLFMFGAVLGTGNSSVLVDSAAKENQRALEELRSNRMRMDKEIEEKQCTLDAKAKAGALKAVEDARYDGAYAGKGATGSWCAAPTANLKVEAGRVTGSVTDGATSYQVKGQAFEDGSLSLLFKRADARSFTDDFEGKLERGVVSFAAPLDASAKACTYRFSLRHTDQSEAARARSAGQIFTGPWKAHNILIEEKSAGICEKYGGTYALDLTSDILTVDNSAGRMFTAPIPADGTIKQAFKSPTGARLEMVGNARARDLEIVNPAFGCRWKLTPN